jgi:hypothetical protein
MRLSDQDTKPETNALLVASRARSLRNMSSRQQPHDQVLVVSLTRFAATIAL